MKKGERKVYHAIPEAGSKIDWQDTDDKNELQKTPVYRGKDEKMNKMKLVELANGTDIRDSKIIANVDGGVSFMY